MKIEEIFELSEKRTGININSKSRKRYDVECRYMTFYLAYNYADGYVNDSVLENYCEYDRCTILRAVKQFPHYIAQNHKLQPIFTELKEICKNKSDVEKFYLDYDNDKLKRIAVNQRYIIRQLRKQKDGLVIKINN
jgi:hypothetical protein